MKSPVIKRSVARRSVAIAGNNTSVTIEDAFWTALKEIAAAREMTLSNLFRRVATSSAASSIAEVCRARANSLPGRTVGDHLNLRASAADAAGQCVHVRKDRDEVAHRTSLFTSHAR